MEETEQPLHDDYVYAVKDEEAYLQADDEKPPIPSEPFPLIVCQFCGKPFEQAAGLFEANAESGIPTPQPSRPCGSATSALPGWRRSSPRSRQDLDGSKAGGTSAPIQAGHAGVLRSHRSVASASPGELSIGKISVILVSASTRRTSGLGRTSLTEPQCSWTRRRAPTSTLIPAQSMKLTRSKSRISWWQPRSTRSTTTAWS